MAKAPLLAGVIRVVAINLAEELLDSLEVQHLDGVQFVIPALAQDAADRMEQMLG